MNPILKRNKNCDYLTKEEDMDFNRWMWLWMAGLALTITVLLTFLFLVSDSYACGDIPEPETIEIKTLL